MCFGLCLFCCSLCSIIYECVCSCFKKEVKKKKTKLKTKRTITSDKTLTKDRTKKYEFYSSLKTVSEIPENELLGKYLIILPKDNCTEPEQWLKTQNYEITKDSLGKGFYGEVFRAIRHTPTGKSIIAVKTIEFKIEGIDQRVYNSLKNEIFIAEELMRHIEKLKHDHIIRLYDRYVIEYKELEKPKSKAFIFMELASGDLNSELSYGPMSDSVAKRYFSQMVYAIEYMHRINIAHRDIKLENILLVPSKTDPKAKDIKVSDFGLSKVQYKEDTGFIFSKKVSGTRPYMAPEILRLKIQKISKRTEEYDVFKTDIWALGVCLYKMLTNRLPFKSERDDESLKQMLSSQENKEFEFSSDININFNAIDLIRRLLEPNPDIRPKIAVVRAHKWLEGENSISLTAQTITQPIS